MTAQELPLVEARKVVRAIKQISKNQIVYKTDQKMVKFIENEGLMNFTGLSPKITQKGYEFIREIEFYGR